MDILWSIHPGYPAQFGCILLLLVGVATRTRAVRLVFLIPIAFAMYTLQKHKPSQIAAGCNNVLFATAVDYLLLSDVQRDIQLRYLVGRGVDAPKNITNQPFVKRLVWASHLLRCHRGIDWNHGKWADVVPSIFQGTESRRVFLESRTKLLFLDLITLYTSSRLAAFNPFFQQDGPAFSQQTMLQRSWSNVLFAAQVASLLSIVGSIAPGLVAVGMRWNEPCSWPLMFGSFKAAYTVRRFWRYTWHQMFRRIITTHAKFCTERILNIQPRTKCTWRINVFLAFLSSGALHITTTSSIRPMPFFLLQAIVIIAEEYILNKLGNSPVAQLLSPAAWRRIGFVWVWCWFAWSSSSILDCWVKSGSSSVPMYIFKQLMGAM